MKDCFVTMLTIDIPGEMEQEEGENPETATYTDKVIFWFFYLFFKASRRH